MRYFLTGRQPDPAAILLVESGTRGIVEDVAEGIRRSWGSKLPIDLVSCFRTPPRGFEPESTRVYCVSDYQGRERRRALYRELIGTCYTHMGIVCSNEPIMLKWKWALALRLPVKVFIINENGDYFWLDRTQLATIRHFAIFRAGLAGAGAVRTLVRVLSFPFTLAYLILYAAIVHARRAALRRGVQ